MYPRIKRIAIILGGAWCWRDDLNEFALHCGGDRETENYDYYAVNDQIAAFPLDIIACTLHPENIARWINQRAERGLPAPREIWTREHKSSEGNLAEAGVSASSLAEWGGTSGLFAFQVAREHGHERIIFCGVPMDEGPNAFHDIGAAIAKYTRHRDVWKRNMPAIAPFARSMSGWTSEQLGKPTEQWLYGESDVETVTDHV